MTDEPNDIERKALARAGRSISRKYDPLFDIKLAAAWFVLGACFIAALNFGDVWICVGACPK